MRVILLSLFLFPILLFANPVPHYNPETVRVFEGKISSVQTFGDVTRPTPHKQILMRTLQGEVVVDLGPVWFIELQDINLYPGEQVKVVGSLIKIEGTRYVIASSITINNNTVKLREANGLPVWGRW